MRIVPDDRGRGVFHHVHEARVGVRASQSPDQRGGEDDIADEAQAEQQNRARRDAYGSIVASSISMTGMSSLIW
jgi:hypothetical protein